MLTNAPSAAAPNVTMRRYGPSAATLKFAWVGATSTAEIADSPPATTQEMALTRLTEIPERRAASGLLAAARICLPRTEYFMKTANPITSSGTSTAVRIHIPLNRTPPTSTWDANGWG